MPINKTKRTVIKRNETQSALYELCHSNVTPSSILQNGELAGNVAYAWIRQKAFKNRKSIEKSRRERDKHDEPIKKNKVKKFFKT
jgi:hypothetical protein